LAWSGEVDVAAIGDATSAVVGVGLAGEGVLGIGSVKVILDGKGVASRVVDAYIEQQAHGKGAVIHYRSERFRQAAIGGFEVVLRGHPYLE